MNGDARGEMDRGGRDRGKKKAMTLTKRCPIQNAQLVVVVIVYSDSDSRVMIIQWMVEGEGLKTNDDDPPSKMKQLFLLLLLQINWRRRRIIAYEFQ